MEQVVYTARLDLPAGPPGVSVGRAAAQVLLRGWGVADDGLLDRVELIISELISNTVRHTGGPSALELTLDDTSVTVTVADSDPQHPTTRDPTDHDGGRGLPIVAALSTRWGSHPAPNGKRVWARIEQRTRHVP